LGIVVVNSPTVTIPPGGTSYGSDPNSLRAQCPAGYNVLGTGVDTGIGNLDLLKSYGTFVGGFVDNDVSITIQASVQAICGQTPGVTATLASARSRFARDAAALAAKK
jgi:hypothetical protein